MLKTLGKLRNAQRRTWTVTADTRHQHSSEKSAEYVHIMVVESKKARQLEALKLALSLSLYNSSEVWLKFAKTEAWIQQQTAQHKN